jgi:chloramphenicol 3-O-phosphotransferase
VVPVLLISGPVGAGKTTIAAEIGALLRDANRPHAIVDLAVIGQCWPPPADDPWNERLIHRNLAALWRQFDAAGARELVLCRVLEDRALLRHVHAAVPGADIVVVHLHAPITTLHARIRRREAGRDPTWYLDTATHLSRSMRPDDVADLVVDNDDRPARAVAAEILSRTGWLPPSG